jgi:FkbM family methyltransferase
MILNGYYLKNIIAILVYKKNKDKNMNNFSIYGVDYSFDPSNNSKIVNYEDFMDEFSTGNWENDTFRVFDMVKDSNKTAIDIGTWIGPTVIWLSKNFKNVIGVEADKVAISALKGNLKSSNCNNVEIIENPIYSKSNVKLFFGSNTNIQAELGDSTSQLKNESTNNQDSEALTVTLSDIIKNPEDVSFIKVDIEGGEENIIPELFETCSKYKYNLWISFHYPWWKDSNIERFEKYFALAKNPSMPGDERNIVEFVKKYPFGSILLKF